MYLLMNLTAYAGHKCSIWISAHRDYLSLASYAQQPEIHSIMTSKRLPHKIIIKALILSDASSEPGT